MNIAQIGMDCVGCYNCENVCPHKAIRLLQDKEGFFYPEINIKLCNDCGACYRHCPQTAEYRNLDGVQISYHAISKQRKLYKKSASGGIFATLAYMFLLQHDGARVCGATYCEGRVHHIMIRSIDELSRLQGSKYVQSQLGDLFVDIRDLLKQGIHVLFSGTPCQVAALYAFLGHRNCKSLVTVDIICHGVPSPVFFERDLSLYASSIERIENVQFREKHPLFKSKSDFCLKVVRDRSYFCRKVTSILKHDPYFSLFSKGWTLRWSCYQCRYACLKRVGDITIGDCDSWSKYPRFHPNEATSTVIVNTSVGESFWSETNKMFDFVDLDLQVEANINHQLRYPFACPIERKTIYEELNKLTMPQIRNRYARSKSLRSMMGRIMYTVFPYCISKRIAKVILNYLKS